MNQAESQPRRTSPDWVEEMESTPDSRMYQCQGYEANEIAEEWHDMESVIDKLREENEQLRTENDTWRGKCGTATANITRLKKERDWLRSRAIQDGQAVLVYMDEGPKGPCAQSMNVMAPRTAVHVFPDADALRAFAKQHFHTASDHRRRPAIRYFINGEEGGDTLTIHGHEEPAGHRCALCNQNPRDIESKDAP